MDRKTKDLIKKIAILVVLACLALYFKYNETSVDDKYTESSETDSEEAYNSINVEEAKSNTKTVDITYKFRNDGLWIEHFEKHGEEFPYSTKEDYLEGANIMMENPDKLHKIEKEDGDDVYYLETTNEFIIVSKDGYLRTYFKPSRGKAYYDKK